MRKTVYVALHALSFIALTSAIAAKPMAKHAHGNAQRTDFIAAAVADPARPAEDVARDGDRKPAQTIAFAGIKSGDSVGELLPGGGYYTRILSATVGPKGKVYAIVPESYAKRAGALDKINAIISQYKNVELIVADLSKFTTPKPLDAIWTSENYHDLHNAPNANLAAFNATIFKALKPGGVFYIEDHNAPGTGISATSTLHRIDAAAVRSEVQAAGFKLEAESDILANTKDDHTTGPFDPAIKGHTDRMVLRFRKPKTDK